MLPHPNRLIFTFSMDGSDCPICLEPLRKGFITPCGHKYHCACLRKHMRTSLQCPMCRATLPLSLDDVISALVEEEARLLIELERTMFLRLYLNASEDLV